MTLPRTLSVAFLAVLIAAGGPAMSATKHIEFDGTPTAEPKTGYLFAASKEKDSVVVANTKSLFIVEIPFSTSWKFDIENAHLLRGEAERFLLTIEEQAREKATPNEELAGILARLKKDGSWEIAEDEILSIDEGSVLRYRLLARHVPKELEKINGWIWHYWAVTPTFSETRWARTHVSIKAFGVELPDEDNQAVLNVLSRQKTAAKQDKP